MKERREEKEEKKKRQLLSKETKTPVTLVRKWVRVAGRLLHIS